MLVNLMNSVLRCWLPNNSAFIYDQAVIQTRLSSYKMKGMCGKDGGFCSDEFLHGKVSAAVLSFVCLRSEHLLLL